jgi:hypothetical protein
MAGQQAKNPTPAEKLDIAPDSHHLTQQQIMR